MLPETEPLAVTVMPLETRRDAILHLATRADDLGYLAFALTETWSHDTTVILTEVATHTQHIRLGTGILGVWGRSAATIAMAAATLDIVSDGRFMLGLGASTKQLAEGLHDTSYHAPYRKLRQTILQVKALLKGERIPLAVAEKARPLRLNLPPRPDIPLFLAASSPRSIAIAGELCEGWIPFLYPRDRLPEAIRLLHESAAHANRPPASLQVCPSVPTMVARDTETARTSAAWFVAFYIMVMGPIYRSTLARLGYAAEVEAIVAANTGRKPAIVPEEAGALLEQLTIFGTPEEARTRLAQWYEAGAHMPFLALHPNLSREETDFTLSAFRPAPGHAG